MQFETYWRQCGLPNYPADPAALAPAVHTHLAALQALLQPQALASADVQWSYRVPELGEGGACSLFGQLADKPVDLAEALGGRTPGNQQLLARATAVVRYYREHSRSQWFGVYQVRRNAAGEPVLLKLAYFGAESRAEFPLTPEFAQGSNNSAVGLSGQGRLINDVAAFVAEGGGYYTCDPKVKAEGCLPLFNASGEVTGILDSEAFEPDFFNGDELALVLAVALALGGDAMAAGAATPSAA